jgi:outer membrane protein
MRATMSIRKSFAVLLAWMCVTAQLPAQQPFVERPQGRIVWRPYKQPSVGPAILANSDRLRGLIRGGILYLTLQDAIALAIENNLDLQVDRYGPLAAEWVLERYKAGGPLRGVTSGNSVVNSVTSGQGAAGALVAGGLSTNTGGSGGNNSNGQISQIGPITPNLDPVFQNSSVWSHQTTPESNIYYYGTSALVDIAHRFNSSVQQGLITGGYVLVSGNESYLNENSPYNNLNPSVLPSVQLYLQHNLLQGFGAGVNSRTIRVSQKQLVGANVTFRSQLTVLVQNVVNLYWDLVSSNEDLRAKEKARDVSEKFFEDTKKQIDLGALAKVEVYRAEADFNSRKQEVAIAQQTRSQQETELKGLLSRNGVEDPLLDAARIVTLDRIQVPDADEIPTLRQLVATALAHRPDVELDKINDEVAEINATGTVNNLLPFLQGRLYTINKGLAGTANPAAPSPPPGQYTGGGLGNALGQIFDHDYTTRSAALIFQPYIHNRGAQADYAVDQLQLRQGDLVERKNRNDMVVAISNDMIALRQARSRYTNAVISRTLQQDLLEKEQQKFSLGSSTIDLIIAAERTLSAAQYVEISALANYSRARVALDQVLGTTLDTNHVSIEESLKGKLSVESRLPAVLPEAGSK